MKREPNKPGYAVLTKLCDPFFDGIVKLTTVELAAALLALEQLTTTNCSWRVYRMRALALEQLEEWHRDRLMGPHFRCGDCDGIFRIERRSGPHAAGARCEQNHHRWLRRRELAELERVADQRWRDGDASNHRWLAKRRERQQ